MSSKNKFKNKMHIVEEHFRLGLSVSKTQIAHPGTQGGAIEDRWMKLLRDYLPCRYTVARGFVVDSHGHVSNQIDCIVYDAFYTPSLYSEGDAKYIPAESVYAVFESKPNAKKDHVKYADDKAKTVLSCRRTSSPIVDRGKLEEPRELFDIISGLLAVNLVVSPNTAKNHLEKSSLDVILCADSNNRTPFYADKFNGRVVTTHNGQGALIAGLIRLLGQLQSMGTVAPIDWKAYEKKIG